MSSVVYGLALLIGVDAALYIWGRKLLDSGVVDSNAGYSIFRAWGTVFFVWSIHFVATLFAWRIMGDMATVFFSSLLTATPAAIVWGIFAIHATTSQVDRMLMGHNVDGVSVQMPEALRCLREGNLLEAEKAYRGYMVEFPDSPDPHFGLEALLEQQRRYDDAADVYRTIMRRFESEQAVWTKAAHGLAQLLEEQLEDAGAARRLRAVIKERNPETRYGYLFTKKAGGRERPNALGSPVDDFHDLNRARALVKKEEVDRAAELFRRYFEKHSDDARPLFEIAMAYEGAGRHDDEKLVLQDIIRKFPHEDDWAEAALRLAAIHENHTGDKGAAKSILEQVCTRFPRTDRARIANERLQKLDELS